MCILNELIWCLCQNLLIFDQYIDIYIMLSFHKYWNIAIEIDVVRMYVFSVHSSVEWLLELSQLLTRRKNCYNTTSWRWKMSSVNMFWLNIWCTKKVFCFFSIFFTRSFALCSNSIFFLDEYLLWDFTLFCLKLKKGLYLPKKNFTLLSHHWLFDKDDANNNDDFFLLFPGKFNALLHYFNSIRCEHLCAKWLWLRACEFYLCVKHERGRWRREHWTSICWDLKSSALNNVFFILLSIRLWGLAFSWRIFFQKCNAMRVNKRRMNAFRITVW